MTRFIVTLFLVLWASMPVAFACSLPLDVCVSRVIVGNFDNDGEPDYLFESRHERYAGIYLSLSSAERSTRFLHGWPSATGDFNGDGITDLIYITPYSERATLLLGNGDGTFKQVQVTLRFYTSLTVYDYNGDGLDDLILSDGLNPPMAYLSNGDGTFQGDRFVPVRRLPIAE